MAAHSTRLLLLGAVAMFEPVNGYQIRRELVSWQVDEWANVQPGSIYSGLTTLEKRGFLVRHDIDDDTRQVAVYEITATGRAELARLMGDSLETFTPTSSVAFHVAFGILPLLERPVAIAHLERRTANIDAFLVGFDGQDASAAPPHALHGLELWREVALAEQAWLAGTLDRLRRGDFDLAGEPWRWTPAADDPGHQMTADRERYLRLLGR